MEFTTATYAVCTDSVLHRSRFHSFNWLRALSLVITFRKVRVANHAHTNWPSHSEYALISWIRFIFSSCRTRRRYLTTTDTLLLKRTTIFKWNKNSVQFSQLAKWWRIFVNGVGILGDSICKLLGGHLLTFRNLLHSSKDSCFVTIEISRKGGSLFL